MPCAGYENPQAVAYVDPPDDFMRVRIVLAILQVSGHYFTRGAARAKLDRFLLFFQRYLLTKEELPADLEFDWSDLFQQLKPQHPR
jgi:regulator of nonsense transcripts 2